ncbi:MAG: hypothetical protein WC606_01840 [Candidatus Absconditabacterales bacterium]
MTQDDKDIEQASTNIGIEKIKINVDEIKKSVNELKNQIETFDKDKNNLAKEILEQKQKEIEEKKIEIEKKKTETLELIKKTKELEELKSDINSQKELADLEKELQGIETTKKGFREKIKEGSGKTRERIKEHKKPILIATGIGAGILLLMRLFRKKKKNNEEDGEKKDKKEKKSRWKKALIWAGIGTGGALIWKNRDKIKGRIGDLFGGKPKEGDGRTADIESSGKEFKEKLTSGEKLVYNNFADKVNEFYMSGAGEFPDELQKDKLGSATFEIHEKEKISGMVPFMLNNRYTKDGGIDKLLSESAFYKEAGMATDENGIFQKMKTWTADQLGSFLAPIAGSIDGMLPAFLRFKTSRGVEDLVEWIKGNSEARTAIRLAFRKSIMVISYLNSKENNLKYTIATNILSKEDNSFSKKSSEDQNDIIADKLSDEKFYSKNIDPIIKQFRSKSLYEGIKFLEEKKCLDSNLDPLIKEAVDNIEKRKNKLLDQDKDGNNRIEDIKDKFESGKLSVDGQRDLDELLEDFEEEINDVGSKSWYNKYLPLMNFFDPSDDIMDKIMKSGDYDAMVKIYRDRILVIKEKSKKGTLTEYDMDDLKKIIDDYCIFQKSLVMSQTNIEEVFDKNGNKIIRWGNTIVLSGESLRHGGELFIDKKYLQGGALIVGSLVSLDIATYPIRLGIGLARGRIASSPSLKFTYKIGKFAVKKTAELTGKSLNIAMRNYMPARISAKMYKGKDYIFRYELSKGNLSLGRALEIAKRNSIKGRITDTIIKSEEELIQRVVGVGNSPDDIKNVKLVKDYWNNKNILKQIIKSEYNGKRYTMSGRAEKYSYEFTESIKQLKSIDEFLTSATHAGKSSLVNGFLETTKSLKPDMIQEMFATQTFDKLSVGASKDIGRLLGKNMHKFSSVDDFKAFQGFFARNYTTYPSETFVRNALSKWGKLSTLDDIAQTKYIETAELNISRYEKIANKVKSGVNNMITDMNKLLKNPKMKSFYSGIKSKITNLTEYSKTVTPESIKATQEASRLDKITGFGKLTPEGITELTKLNALIKTDQALLKSLQGAKKLEDVKSLLTTAGIDATKIDEGVLMKIAQTKNAGNIESIVNYGAEINSINVLRKIFQNPAMKVFGRYLVVVGVITDIAFVGIDFTSETSEAARVKQYNLARGENKETEAYYDVVVGSAGALAGLGAGLAIFGLVSNPVGWVCLGASGVAYGAKELGDLYYGEIDKFKQNYKDFLAQSMPEIKQRLLYINSRQTGLDSSFQDLWSNITGNMGAEEKKNLSPKTSADAVKALIYLEELQKYPYAAANLNAAEVRNNPDLEALVKQQKNSHDKAVETRYDYIKKNYIDGKTSIVNKDAVEKNQGIQALDSILAESRMCQAVNDDAGYTNKTDVKGYPKYLESQLQKSNADGFVKLEKMYADNKIHFFQIVASLPYYESMLTQYSVDSENYDKLVANLEFFKKYVNYKLLNVAISDYPAITLDKDKIDYDEITNLLSSRVLTATILTAAEVSSANVEYLTDTQINEKYNVSSNLGQNVLYEIANKKLGYTGKNNLSDLKTFYSDDQKSKETKGIYFDASGDKDWAINENNGSDNEFATDAELNDKDKIIEMRGYIDDAANSSTTGNMIAGNDTANKEYANYYIDIINQNLNYRINPTKYHLQLLNYIKANSKGSYIQLPPDLLILGIKSGVPNIGAFVYRRDGKKLEARSGIKGITSILFSV